MGGYELDLTGQCDLMNMNAKSYDEGGELVLTTYWVDEDTLKHTLVSRGSEFVKTDVDWAAEMELFIETAEGDSLLLTVKSTQWSEDLSTLTFFTNNPLIIDESDLKMPFARRRRVLEGPAVLNSRTRMTMTENTKTAILPGYSESGDLALSYDLNGASFYSSYLKYHSNFLLEIIGTLFILILFIKYSVKALVTVP